MIPSEALLDAAAWVVAGRLLLVTHLDEVRTGFLSDSKFVRDHELLATYGYSMEGCSCVSKLVDATDREVQLWQDRFA